MCAGFYVCVLVLAISVVDVYGNPGWVLYFATLYYCLTDSPVKSSPSLCCKVVTIAQLSSPRHRTVVKSSPSSGCYRQVIVYSTC